MLSKHLKKLAKVLKKYEKPKNSIIFPIFSKALETKDKKEILDEFKPKDRAFMRKVFQCFWPIFSFYFQEAKPRLKKFIKLFENPEIEKLIKKSLKIIGVYFGKPSSEEIIVYLLMFPEHLMGGGGANVGKNKITAEIGNISFKGLRFSLSVILHEVIHICFQSPGSYLSIFTLIMI